MTTTITLNQEVTLLDAVTATGAGTGVALPGNRAILLTWITKFGTAPSAVSLTLEGSSDGGTTWNVLDTSTSTSAVARTITTSMPLIRANLGSKTNGTTFSVLAVARNA